MLYHVYMWFSYFLSAVLLVYLVYKSMLAQKNKPVVSKADITYQEWFASGFSEANILTKLGGSRNCLWLIATADYLIVTAWFPFSLFAAFYDLEHVIPLKAILPIQIRRTFGMKYLGLVYEDSQGQSHKIGLIPKDWEGFLKAVGQDANPTS